MSSEELDEGWHRDMQNRVEKKEPKLIQKDQLFFTLNEFGSQIQT